MIQSYLSAESMWPGLSEVHLSEMTHLLDDLWPGGSPEHVERRGPRELRCLRHPELLVAGKAGGQGVAKGPAMAGGV